MGKDILELIKENVDKEPYVKLFGMKVLELRQKRINSICTELFMAGQYFPL